MSSLNRNKPLNIFRASAGSGKTHLLTGFYIKQLFLAELLPETHSGDMHFSEVLAVTFTNKATAEMKSRIIEELYLLSRNPKKSDYWEEISNHGQKAEKAIKEKALGLLVQILNEYSSFNISTIDSFFQKIVRGFARELNVAGNYEIELDSKKVVEQAINSFLDKLDPKRNNALFEWMVRFSEKRGEEGESWDFRATLFELADKVLNSEVYRQHSKKIKEFTDDKKQLHAYEEMLGKIMRSWKDQLVKTGQKGLDLMAEYGAEKSEFRNNGSGTISFFQSWAKGEEKDPTEGARFQEVINEPDKLFKNKSPRIGTELQKAIIEVMEMGNTLFSADLYCNYLTASFIQRDFYELGIIANIDEELRDYCNEQNIMLLNSATELLSKLIGPYDAPFVYEKTGTHLKSYMIDEFQDTSGMQWHNFMPLVSDTLSQGYHNLIVGDVKQSIYRWRGSDWGLLDHGLSSYEPALHNDNDKDLRTNWRSLPAIVEFNNQFFERVSEELSATVGTEQIKRIYKDVRQLLPSKRLESGKPLGLVHLEQLTPISQEGEKIPKPSKEDYLEEAKRQLPLQIIRLQEAGFAPGDIAILCRRKRECQLMAEALLQYKQEHPECPYPMDIVSGEALQLGSRPVIQTLVSMMQLLRNPASELQQAVTWSNYLQLQGNTSDEALSIFFKMDKEQRELLPQLTFRPLYELTEILISLLPEEIHIQEAPFLQAFRDIVLEFCRSKNADISAFLDWWETSGCTKTITTPEDMNAIQIMTIHKSKGLGMPAVIIPFASWDIDIDTSPLHHEIIWCEPKIEPFKQELLLPIKLDKKLAQTIFKEDFAEERLRSIIDNLNTAYVAFTRSKEAMILMVPGESKCETKLENLLLHFLQGKEASQPFASIGETLIPLDQQDKRYTIGSWACRTSRTPAVSASSYVPISITQPDLSAQDALPELSIMHSPLQKDTMAMRKGTYIHRVLQEMQYAEGFETIIDLLYKRGVIDPAVIGQQEMIQKISQILSIPEVKSWFEDGLTVLNEQTLMNVSGEQIRPDRVIIDGQGQATVIDYKTGSDHRGYRKQVKEYMMTLRSVGFKRVKGFLFFIKDERIVEVR